MALLQIQALAYLNKWSGSGRAPDNVPTRVNVASRYLGNKACNYETLNGEDILAQGPVVSCLSPPGRSPIARLTIQSTAETAQIGQLSCCIMRISTALLMYCRNVFGPDFRVAGLMCRKTARRYYFLYGKPARHAQHHTNHKPVFAELA